jgi:hypothetical protein
VRSNTITKGDAEETSGYYILKYGWLSASLHSNDIMTNASREISEDEGK